MKLYPFIIILLLFACNQNPSSRSKISSSSPISVIAVREKIDTIYNDYLGTDKFSEQISFGMTLREWNRFVSKQAKKGVFEEIDDKGLFGSYKGFNPSNQNRQGSFAINAQFLETIKKIGNKYELVRINKTVQSEPILNEVDLEYIYLINPYRTNQIVNEFIKDHNLNFVTGYEPMNADDSPATIKDYEFDNELQKRSGTKNLANKTTLESRTPYTQSVFENKKMFAIITIQMRQDNQLSRDYNGDIIAIEQEGTYFSIKIRACSKKFSNIDINEFRTSQQKEEMDSKRISNELINKALEKQNIK